MRTGIQAAALLALALTAGAARAQEGTLGGRVVEAGTGAPVPGARVEVDGPRAAAAETGADGGWSVPGLPEGSYTLRVQGAGYAAATAAARVPAAAPVRVALQGKALALDALVVTASRRMQALRDAPVSTEVVTRDEIARTGASDLASVLTERTGIQLEGGHPAGTGVMLQGLGSERVLVLLDGEPLVGRISGNLDLSRIPAASVERVEVVKGPQSTLYGSEAMGGVVHVVTRAPEGAGWGGGAQLAAGTQGRVDASAAVRGGAGPLGWTADVGRRLVETTPGQSARADARSERRDALAKVRWEADPSLRVEGSFRLLDERQRWRSGQLFHFADNREWSARLGAAWERGRHRIAPAVYATAFDHLARRGLAAAPPPAEGGGEVQRLVEGELLYGASLGRLLLDAGVEARAERIRSDRVLGRDRALGAVAGFVQGSWQGSGWSVVPGARLTHSEQWGTHATPHLAVLVRPSASLALRASGGAGYRAPAFKELYMEFLNATPALSYAVRGNPDLRPETSRNLSLGVEWASDLVYLRGQAFHNRFHDFIETRLAGDSAGVTLYTYGNVARGVTRGVDVEAGGVWGALRGEAGYGLLLAEDHATGDPLLGRPRHSARAMAEYALPVGLRAALTGSWTGDTPLRRTDAGLAARDDFFRMDLRLAQSLPRGLTLSAGADNLLDARPGEWPGFAGRHLYLALGWEAAPGAR
jgi:outer membrane receptor for ferrienterochelin and colicins